MSKSKEGGVSGPLVAEYQLNPTPEIAYAISQEIWRNIELRIAGLLPAPLAPVLPLDNTLELRELRAAGLEIGFIPPEFDDPSIKGILLKGMFPNDERGEKSFTDKRITTGWFDFEISREAPNSKKTADEMREFLARQGRAGMTVLEYKIASHYSKVLNSHYLDQKTSWTRLLGSNFGAQGVHAYTAAIGAHVIQQDRSPDLADHRIGVRSVRFR